MEGPVYPKSLSARGIDHDIPAAADRETINRVIFEELVHDRFPETSRDEFCRIIEGMKRDGCDAAVLGCTEIPLLVTPDVSPLPVLDSTRILARSAVDRALG
jgi:aspartate racemase